MSATYDPDRDGIGIFARTFARSSLEEVLEACQILDSCPCRWIQLNLASAGLPSIPPGFDPIKARDIAKALSDRKMRVAALSATFNMIDPDRDRRRRNLRALAWMAEWARAIGAPMMTLCTGTRDPDDMWRHHPENDSPEAWSELVESMRDAAATAERHDILLAFEPEAGNVVNSAAKARRLIDEVGSPRLKIVLDVANLLAREALPEQRRVIDEAFSLLGPDIALVHAKEIAPDGTSGHLGPGQGVLDFPHLFRRYRDAELSVPIIMHGLPESAVADSYSRLWWREWRLARSERVFEHDGLRFSYLDTERDGARGSYASAREGLPVVFQHGLGGDSVKMFDLFPNWTSRFLSFDARYHGRTRPLGPEEKIGFRQSADDLLALLDHLGIEKAVIGGLSMGAGIALNFVTRYPERALGLILSRPAWLDEPFPPNVRMFPEMAALIRSKGRIAAREEFRKTTTYAAILAESTDSAAAMLGMFDDPTCEAAVAKFERIPRDCPVPDRNAWRSIRVPTLVLANHQDPIHPYAMGPELSSVIPGAQLRLLTPKCVDLKAHERDFRQWVSGFLQEHFPKAR